MGRNPLGKFIFSQVVTVAGGHRVPGWGQEDKLRQSEFVVTNPDKVVSISQRLISAWIRPAGHVTQTSASHGDQHGSNDRDLRVVKLPACDLPERCQTGETNFDHACMFQSGFSHLNSVFARLSLAYLKWRSQIGRK